MAFRMRLQLVLATLGLAVLTRHLVGQLIWDVRDFGFWGSFGFRQLFGVSLVILGAIAVVQGIRGQSVGRWCVAIAVLTFLALFFRGELRLLPLRFVSFHLAVMLYLGAALVNLDWDRLLRDGRVRVERRTRRPAAG